MGILNSETIRNRMVICTACAFWTNADHCAKAHIITSALGCPIKSFPPVNGSGYAENRPAVMADTKCKTCHSLTAVETLASMAQTLNAWRNSGFELSTVEVSESRLKLCKACAEFNNGRCSICHCYMTLKTKLKTAKCPRKQW